MHSSKNSALPSHERLLHCSRNWESYTKSKSKTKTDKLHLRAAAHRTRSEQRERPHNGSQHNQHNLRLIQRADTHQSKHQAQIAECVVDARGRASDIDGSGRADGWVRARAVTNDRRFMRSIERSINAYAPKRRPPPQLESKQLGNCSNWPLATGHWHRSSSSPAGIQ